MNVPEAQVADNDYAVGLLLEKLSKSPYAGNTLVFVIEDDAHRRPVCEAGRGGFHQLQHGQHYGLTDGTAEPMADVFDLTQKTSLVPPILRSSSTLPAPTALNSLPRTKENLLASKPRHSARRMQGQDFDEEDKLDTVNYNQALKGNVPYPTVRDGKDMSANR